MLRYLMVARNLTIKFFQKMATIKSKKSNLGAFQFICLAVSMEQGQVSTKPTKSLSRTDSLEG